MCLNNLHVFFPASSAQLAASIKHLPEYHKSQIADAGIGIVAVDSLSAWYWQDRFTAEQLALPSASTALQHVLAALQSFRVSHHPVTILTNHGLTTIENYNKPTPVFYKQHLPSLPAAPPEGSHIVPSNIILPLTHHVTLNPTPTPFPPLYCTPSLPNLGGGGGREVVGYIRRPGCALGRFLVDIRV
ncbi:hypothetical protein FB45DRAFT_917493 [Roridomyces roridus]|uniref:DNA recombination and repair protein Rad51-like C-terminal domain-containing protein n=1 Tax=Roridomyces roridus TaxID=1738132 RepID=A0AAD7BUR5_9AGAR|nr:hypothetical protein FB45DRAFT_917493 [Roridomyces roridus]